MCKDATLRLPVEKLKKSELPSCVKPSFVGFENCCSNTGRCASNLERKNDEIAQSQTVRYHGLPFVGPFKITGLAIENEDNVNEETCKE